MVHRPSLLMIEECCWESGARGLVWTACHSPLPLLHLTRVHCCLSSVHIHPFGHVCRNGLSCSVDNLLVTSQLTTAQLGQLYCLWHLLPFSIAHAVLVETRHQITSTASCTMLLHATVHSGLHTHTHTSSNMLTGSPHDLVYLHGVCSSLLTFT